MSTPRVSVVIPTRNRAGLVPAAVRTALAQSHRDLEVIVVDDASDDDTPAVLAALAAADGRVRAVRRETRGGAPRARNAGVRAARGRVIAFLDDDCVWDETKLAKQLPLLVEGRDVAYTRQAVRHSGRWIVEGKPAGPSPLESLLRTNFIGAPSLVVRRELFEEVGGFDESLPRLQDWDLLLRLARETAFGFVPEILVRGVQVEGGISLDREPLRQAARLVVDRQAAFLSRRQLAALHYGLGKFLLVDGLTDTARSFFRTAVRLDPASPLNWAGLGAGLLGPLPARAIRALRRARREAEAGDDWKGGPPPAEGER